MILLTVTGCATKYIVSPSTNDWYCSEGYLPIGLTDIEARALPQRKVDRIDGNDANFVERCLTLKE